MELMDEKKLQTLAVLVDNESGVLSQVSRLFSRKGYNIESLVVGTTENPKISRITIDVLADEQHITLVSNQLRKLLPVHSVKRLTLWAGTASCGEATIRVPLPPSPIA